MPDTPVVFSDQDIDQAHSQSSQPLTFGEDDIAKAPEPRSTVPRANLDPLRAAAQPQTRPYPKFSDVVGSIWNQPDKQTQAAVARNTSPQTAASKAAGMPLADVAGKPQEPQGEEYIGRDGMVHRRSAVPEADAIPILDAWKGVEPVATGLSRITENAPKHTLEDPHMAMFQPSLSAEDAAEEEKRRRQRSLGAAEVLQGSGELMTPVAVGAGLVNPLPVATGYGAGLLASEGTGAAVHGHVSPEDEQLIRAAAFFLPSVAGVATGLKTTYSRNPGPRGTSIREFSAFGDKVGGAVRITPEDVTIGGRIGETQVGKKFSRGFKYSKEPLPPDADESAPVSGTPNNIGPQRQLPQKGTPFTPPRPPIPITGTPHIPEPTAPAAPPPEAPAPAAPPPARLTESLGTMVNAKATEAMAKNVAQGLPPTPPAPPPPPTEAQQFGNKLSGAQVDHITQAIAAHPPEARDALIEEAHNKLTQWIAENGRVFIDGRVYQAKDLSSAGVLAEKIINNSVDAHDKQAKESGGKTENVNGSKSASEPSISPVKPVVERSVGDEQVLRPIISPNPVDMVDVLGGKKAATYNSLHDKPVLQNVPAVDSRGNHVPLLVNEVLPHGVPVAGLGAEGSVGLAEAPLVNLPTSGTGEDNSSATLQNGNAAPLGAGDAQTSGAHSGSLAGDRAIPADVGAGDINGVPAAADLAGKANDLQSAKARLGTELPADSHGRGDTKNAGTGLTDEGNRHRENIKQNSAELDVKNFLAQSRPKPQQFTEQDIQPERRTNLAERKRVADMSEAEKDKELLTAPKTGLLNSRAFDESGLEESHPHVGFADVDDFKSFNTAFGHKGVDTTVLPAIGEMFRRAINKEPAGHIHAYQQTAGSAGDEFLMRSKTPEAIKRVMERINKELAETEFEYRKPDGTIVKKKGTGLKHGIGDDPESAEADSEADKQRRTAAGLRSGERDVPAVDSRSAAGERTAVSDAAGREEVHAEEPAGEVASEVTPQAFHESEIEHELPEGIPAKGQAGRSRVDDLTIAPKEFQYKLNTNEHGVTNLLSGQKWNDDLAGVISVWHNPADGKTYVVNGHHRVQLAKENGVHDLLVRHLDVNSAGEARATGALQNIAEGRGTAVDAAKFFRESGISLADLSKHGVSLGEAKAADGLALSKLDQSIFERVATGKMSEGRGVAIGQATSDPAQQEAIVKLLDKREKQGKSVTDGTVAELARFVGSSGNKTIEQGGLFGANQQIHSLALEKSEISAYIKSQIAKERRVFGSVASEDKAAALGQVKGQKLKAEQNKRIADAAGQAEEAYNKLSSHTGPVNDILEKSAKELASGYHKPEDVKGRAYQAVRAELRKTVTGSEGPGAERGKKDSGPGSGDEEAPAFSLEKPSPTFFSKAEKVATEKLPNSMAESSVIPALKNAGVKDEEIKWLGLTDWLAGKKLVTKKEMLDFIRQNNVQVKEVMKGNIEGAQMSSAERTEFHELERERRAGTIRPDQVERYNDLSQRSYNDRQAGRVDNTKFSQYQLPGGENYRELLLALPQKTIIPETAGYEVWRMGKKEGGPFGSEEAAHQWASDHGLDRSTHYNVSAVTKNGGFVTSSIDPGFRSSHFDEPNVLAHVRFNDRISPDGKKTLFMEELQSDWHQKGRKSGYQEPLTPAEHDRMMELGGKGRLTDAEFAEHEGLTMRDAGGQLGKVPDTPFKTTWQELAMKRMLRYAAENGYDKLAWTTGEQQAARYDLSKQVRSIQYAKNADGTYALQAKTLHGGEPVDVGKSIPANRLEENVGKDVAQKIIAGEGKAHGNTGFKFLEGDDLKVGGAGMKGFYDKILPDFMNKYGKKWGAKVEDGQIQAGTDNDRVFVGQEPNESQLQDVWKNSYGTLHTAVNNVISEMQDGKSFASAMDTYGTEELAGKLGGKMQYGSPHNEPVHSIDITPSMRDSVLYQGQPLFNLSKDELRDWAVAAGRRIKVEEMGDQGGLFGSAEKMYRLFTSKQNSVAITQPQLDELVKAVPNVARAAGVAPHRAGDVWTEYTPPDQGNLFSAGKPPELLISKAARDLINQSGALSERFNGASLSPDQARTIAANLSKDQGPEARRVSAAISQAADDAGKSGVLVTVEGSPEHVAHEERFHSAQREMGEGQIRDHLPEEAVDRLLEHPAARAMEAPLRAMGYDDNLHPAFKVAEIAAKVATGQMPDSAEAADWFVKYVGELEKHHGEENVARAFSELYDGARKLYEQARAANREAAERPTREGEAGIQSTAEGLPERATGPPERSRTSGDRQDQNRAAIQGTLDQPFLLSRDAGDKIAAMPADKGAGSKPSAPLQPVEAEDELGKYQTFGDAVDVRGNWKRLKQLPDDAEVVLYHATTEENAKKILAEGFKRGDKPTNFGGDRDYTYLGGYEGHGLGSYIGGASQRGGKPVIVVAKVKKSAIEPDHGSDWKSHFRSNPSDRAFAKQNGMDVANPSAVDTYAIINQVRARNEHVQPLGIIDPKTREFTPKSDSRSRHQSGGISAPVKGDTVTLADGRKGEVQFVDANMNVARVKVDGKSVTVGLKTLKDKSGEAGFARLNVPSAVMDMVKAAHEKVFAPAENRIARGVDDTLYQLGKQYDADVLRTIKLLKSVGPTTSPEDQEAIYHHKEDDSLPLTERQENTLETIVQPLMDVNSEMRAKLNKAGVPMGEDDGYIHRVVQGKNNQLERAMKGKGGTGKGNVLSKAASSLKGRSMFAAEDEDGKRVVIHRNGDTMTAFENGRASEFAKDKSGLQVGDEFNDKDGQPWTLKQATTKEIEQHTGIRYYKNALASTVTDYLQLRRAERANDALNAMKADPEFKSLSFKPEHGEMPPDGWRMVNLPQFNGYYFEKHLAETLDRFADDLRMDPAGIMEKAGNLMTASLVLNPARHIYNIGNHWLVERGVTGNFNPLAWPRSAKAGIRAIKAVMTQNDDFVQALDRGAPMMSHRQDLRELHKHMVDSILGFLDKNPTVAKKIAEATGFPNPLAMGKALYGVGQKITWMSNDVFFLQSIYEKELGGMSFEDAAKETAKHIPDYRIPSRVLNSHGLSTFMNSHLLTVFSRYHYGVWKSYGQMLKEVAGPESSLKDRAKGLDHMLMLGLLTFVAYEMWDKLLKHVTGDPRARMVRSGASAIPYLINEIIKGNRPPDELIQGTFTPAVLPKTVYELATNRDSYSGSRIYDRHDPAGTIVKDISKKVGGALGPAQQYQKAERSDTPLRDLLAYQTGVTFPNSEVQSPAVQLMHELLRESMAMTPDLQKQLDDKKARAAAGKLTVKEMKSAAKKQAEGELMFLLPHLSYSDIKKVNKVASPEEQQIIKPIMLKKALGILRNNPYQAQEQGVLQDLRQ